MTSAAATPGSIPPGAPPARVRVPGLLAPGHLLAERGFGLL
ncbi:hypothetical protein [Nocardia brasiliensis]|nr:hypothetical protein [Nocardia brasiliensis]